jgi:hypothetical protein
MVTLYLILLIISAVFFVLAAVNVASQRINLMAAGLFFWVLVPLIQMTQRL